MKNNKTMVAYNVKKETDLAIQYWARELILSEGEFIDLLVSSAIENDFLQFLAVARKTRLNTMSDLTDEQYLQRQLKPHMDIWSQSYSKSLSLADDDDLKLQEMFS